MFAFIGKPSCSSDGVVLACVGRRNVVHYLCAREAAVLALLVSRHAPLLAACDRINDAVTLLPHTLLPPSRYQ